jgi:hypothetical protein
LLLAQGWALAGTAYKDNGCGLGADLRARGEERRRLRRVLAGVRRWGRDPARLRLAASDDARLRGDLRRACFVGNPWQYPRRHRLRHRSRANSVRAIRAVRAVRVHPSRGRNSGAGSAARGFVPDLGVQRLLFATEAGQSSSAVRADRSCRTSRTRTR